MTINKYYHTFGFLVPIDECIEILGFTEDNFTTEIRDNIMEECGFDEDDQIPIGMKLRCWFEVQNRSSHCAKFRFRLLGNGINPEFIIRSFSHDSQYYDTHYVVGIEIGVIDRFGGKYKCVKSNNSNVEPIDILKVLASDKKWFDLLTKHGNKFFGNKENGIFIGEKELVSGSGQFYKNYVCPMVISSTDDCDCCS